MAEPIPLLLTVPYKYNKKGNENVNWNVQKVLQ